MYKGMECRETLKLSHTKPNIRYAERLRGEILNAIELGTFDYVKYFPDSSQLKKLGLAIAGRDATVGDMLKLQFEIYERTLAPSTLISYKRNLKYYHLPQWGDTLVRELKAPAIRAWIVGLDIKARSIRQIFIPLRGALELAIIDEIIENNPLDRVMMNKILSPDAYEVDFEPDPFSADEIGSMLDAARGQVRNVFQFALCTGMRPSEYIALRWPSISMREFRVAVERSRAMGVSREKLKTRSARRTVDLRQGAYDALLAQMEHTYLAGELVFHDPKTRKGWDTTGRLTIFWTSMLKRAKVRYRNLYQTRHTYASTLLSVNENPLYVAKQMGHKDTTMITRNYGRWIEQDGGTLPAMLKKMSEVKQIVLG